MSQHSLVRHLCLLCSWTALAQAPPPQPLDLALEAYRKAHTEARFDDAAARREDARGLLRHAPVDAPQFPYWAQSVVQLYQQAGRNAQARAVAQEALDRAGDSLTTRIMLLNTLADSWQQDGSLLKSLAYREQAVAALESAPVAQPPVVKAAPRFAIASGRRFGHLWT